MTVTVKVDKVVKAIKKAAQFFQNNISKITCESPRVVLKKIWYLGYL